MKKLNSIRHEFIESFPSQMEHGVLYVSIEYKSMGHLCCCGCGNKVVTPLSPTGWRMTFDGRTVSVAPSIGSWNLKCKSHYWITGGQIKWSGAFSEEMIAEVFARDQADKNAFYKKPAGIHVSGAVAQRPPKKGGWTGFKAWLSKFLG